MGGLQVGASELPERNRWSTCLAAGDREQLRAAAAEAEALYEISAVTPAVAGLGMLQIRESVRNEGFHLGEFTLSTAAVRIQNENGECIVGGAAYMCDDEELVRDLAILDGILASHWPGCEDARQLLLAGQERLRGQQQTRHQILATTSVNFSTLDEDG